MPSRFWRASGNALLPGKSVLGPAGGGAATSTWNPSDKDANITLTNSNLTATGGASVVGVRGTASKTSGYFEFTVNNKAGNFVLGLDGGSVALNGGYPGDNTTGTGWQANGNALNNGSAVSTTYATLTTGDSGAVCFKGGKTYFAKWNGSSMVWQDSSDPSAGTGGITPSASMAAGAKPMFTAIASGDALTINTGGSSFLGTVPTGVAAWG